MKKISKKIVSLVTMAAFALTLVPAAAFAAVDDPNNEPADITASKYGVLDEQGNIVETVSDVDVDSTVTTEFAVNNEHGNGTSAALNGSNGGNYIKVWAYDNEAKEVTSAVKFEAVNPDTTTLAVYQDNVWTFANTDNVYNGQEVEVTFTRPGSYTLYAAYGSYNADAEDFGMTLLKSGTTINVVDETVIDNIVARTQYGYVLSFDETDTAVLDLTDPAIRDDFKIGGSDVYTINGVAYEKDGSTANYKKITFDTSRSDVFEFVKDTVTTDNQGRFQLQFSMQSAKNGTISILNEEDGINYTIRVIAATTNAQNIDRSKENGYVLAGTDEHWTEANRIFTDAVQFTITDEKGEAVTGALNDEPATSNANGQHQNYVRIMDKPEDSTLNANDIILYWDEANQVYTLKYDGPNPTNDPNKDKLIPGKYTVRVTLLSTDNATVSFYVDEFGTVQDTEITLVAHNGFNLQQKPTDPGYTLDDEVTLGQVVTASAQYVDENGLKIAATGVEFGFDGKAVRDIDESNATFATAYDTPANESLLGTVINVKAYNAANKQLVERNLTVVDSYNTYSLEFNPTEGPVNEDNDVTVNIVDEDGDNAKINNGTVSAWIADKSNDDAKVSVDTTNANISNGKATISVYSDKETTADVVVVVKAGSAVYAGTLEYTFGTEDPLADRTVVMTIGSSEYVVNNNVVTGDAAPFVDDNWRTMVPIRALAEAFDAEVVWNGDENTVTINYDGATQIVMTVGDENYTVNGEEMTMDTAPVNTGDRVYVPIRFAAEALNFTVTPLYGADGTTASVVFQK